MAKDKNRYFVCPDFNTTELSKIDILNYKTERYNNGDYSLGGFYLIYDNKYNKGYVGKSINLTKRLRQHIINSRANRGIFIDMEMNKRIDDFTFYKIGSYLDYNISFHTRKLETILEHTLIGIFKTFSPYGYNQRYYEQLRIK